MAIMGILTAIKESLSKDLIIINQVNFSLEDKIKISTNFEEIPIDVPKKLVEMGKRMTEVYFNLFIFENHFRSFIKEVSIESYGKDYWDKLNVNKNIKKKIIERKKEESFNKWLSFRGDSDLYYTDLIDLKTIISSNWDIFQSYFPKEPWIITYLEDLYKIRNKVAHSIPIEENERNTVQTFIDNIYNQLEVNLKYINLFKEETTQMKREEMRNEEKTYHKSEEQFLKLEIIDFELIFNYLEMIERGEIPNENLDNTFNAIGREVWKVNRKSDINPQEYAKFEKICKHLLNLMKNEDESYEDYILGVLYPFTFNIKTANILETQSYSYLIELIEQEKYYPNLIRILDHFGYFKKKFEFHLVGAIKNNNIELLDNFFAIINFSKYKEKRIDIIRKLNQMLDEIESGNLGLKDAVKRIIIKFE